MPYSKISQAPESIKQLDGAPLTLSQVNSIAAQADAIEGKVGDRAVPGKFAWPTAIKQFKERHTIKDGRWVPVKTTGKPVQAKRKGLFDRLFNTERGYHW